MPSPPERRLRQMARCLGSARLQSFVALPEAPVPAAGRGASPAAPSQPPRRIPSRAESWPAQSVHGSSSGRQRRPRPRRRVAPPPGRAPAAAQRWLCVAQGLRAREAGLQLGVLRGSPVQGVAAGGRPSRASEDPIRAEGRVRMRSSGCCAPAAARPSRQETAAAAAAAAASPAWALRPAASRSQASSSAACLRDPAAGAPPHRPRRRRRRSQWTAQPTPSRRSAARRTARPPLRRPPAAAPAQRSLGDPRAKQLGNASGQSC
jgi:hypothetical protein